MPNKKYHTFVKGFDRWLREGDAIRLGGREGTITSIDDDNHDESTFFDIEWSDFETMGNVDLMCFPNLEVEDRPLIIPFPIKAEIMTAFKSKTKDEFKTWLDGFPEVEPASV